MCGTGTPPSRRWIACTRVYLGISDTPAWVVAQANQYTKTMGRCLLCLSSVYLFFSRFSRFSFFLTHIRSFGKCNIMNCFFECDSSLWLVPLVWPSHPGVSSLRVNPRLTKKRNAARKVERKDVTCMGQTGNVLRQKSRCLTLLKRSRKRLK
ncbi:hypothetical protein BDP27DRAFT_1324212 [Rhodocollybia butyracea]|uniref:Uncharacterized protein n=1 Tax=Rhodocollybia butyracea TaxID=206335 RepID=A0A9P5PXQ6_9AGAR|nr:hypothetical protein BDP27DRAFT_1324212 [Rhodocollybia butyracea]